MGKTGFKEKKRRIIFNLMHLFVTPPPPVSCLYCCSLVSLNLGLFVSVSIHLLRAGKSLLSRKGGGGELEVVGVGGKRRTDISAAPAAGESGPLAGLDKSMVFKMYIFLNLTNLETQTHK